MVRDGSCYKCMSCGSTSGCSYLVSNKGDPHYVFLAFPWPTGISEDDYRTARRNLLADYCAVVKLEHRDAEDIVGVATEAGPNARYRSEDAVYYDVTNWTEEEDAEARNVQQELGLLKQVKMHRWTEQEYPSKIPSSSLGLSRNFPCPCGSRKRYKRCCGKDVQKQHA